MNLSPWQCALRGAAGFGAVSVIVYGTVAFAGRWLYTTLTETGAYAFWAALYLGGTPGVLGRLLIPAGRRRRFSLLFMVGFLAYALGWVAAYFPLRNKPGELLASLLGPALFAVVLCAGYRRTAAWWALSAVLAIGHGAGYFLGDLLNSTVRGPFGMVLWGVAHGLGYGAAIGWALWRVGATEDVLVRPLTPGANP